MLGKPLGNTSSIRKKHISQRTLRFRDLKAVNSLPTLKSLLVGTIHPQAALFLHNEAESLIPHWSSKMVRPEPYPKRVFIFVQKRYI